MAKIGKVCKCGVVNDGTNFRLRCDKRTKKPTGLVYYNNVCYKCEAARQRERTKLQRKTPEGREMHNRWAREFHQRNRDKCLAYMKKRRESNHGKIYRENYDREHRERIAALGIERNRRYVRDIISNIKPSYIVRMLAHPCVGISPDITRQYPEFIDAYRTHVAIKRFLKGKNNTQWTISYNSERLC